MIADLAADSSVFQRIKHYFFVCLDTLYVINTYHVHPKEKIKLNIHKHENYVSPKEMKRINVLYL